MAPKRGRAGEFDLIARYFAPLAQTPAALGLKDDAALVRPPAKRDLVITKDAIVAGVHFFPGDKPELIARKLLRVNLSDLAAKGAMPFGYLMATAFPKGTQERWIKEFAQGLLEDQARYGVTLLGGDTVATPGPAVFCLTALGWVKRGAMLERKGAKAGDDLWVTGTIGDAALGLTLLKSTQTATMPRLAKALAQSAKERYWLPEPRVDFIGAVSRHAHAAIDISDGLVQDVGHLAAVNGLACILIETEIPFSPAVRAWTGGNGKAFETALNGGDDYEIAFAARPAAAKAIVTGARAAGLSVTRIGRFEAGTGVALAGAAGARRTLKLPGFTHF